jgi:hypothetical protein
MGVAHALETIAHRGGLLQEADQPIQPGNQVAMPGTMKTATSSNTLIAK